MVTKGKIQMVSKEKFFGFGNCRNVSPNAPASAFGTHVKGASLTVPNLAPSLREIIAASLHGEGYPLTHEPMFDASTESGLARVAARAISVAEMDDSLRESVSRDETEEVKPEEPERSPKSDGEEGGTEAV